MVRDGERPAVGAGRRGTTEALADDEHAAAFGDQLEDAKAPPAIPTWEEVAAAIDGQIEQVTLGDTAARGRLPGRMQQEAESIGTGL